MPEQIVITCPECKKQLKASAELQGKRVRCKGCGNVFAVGTPTPSKSAPPRKAAAGAEATKKKPPAPPAANAEEESGKNPYGLTDVALSSRCPQCAAQMDSPDAVICLNCGYNTQSRQRITTVRAYAHTPFDWMFWLAPGILCALVVLSAIGLICFLLIPAGLERVAGDAWWGHFSIQIYGSALAAGIGWIAGKFAFRRLVQNPRPPEKFKRASDQ
ncbi:MAG TPA: hypothetical protein VKU02_09085 [Gemmataceae bacterium]|nr:hypothetical protein [Gemmataceae bacterium]